MPVKTKVTVEEIEKLDEETNIKVITMLRGGAEDPNNKHYIKLW